jgi:glucokinase
MYAIGVDVGGTKIAAGVVDGSGTIISRVECPTPASPGAIDRAIADLVLGLRTSYGADRVGVAAAGLVSSDRAVVMFAPNVHWRNHPIAQNIRDLVGPGVSVTVENDANAAAWAEYRFGSLGDDNLLMLTIGTGVGGGAIVDGRVMRGAYGAAAEVGHIQLVDGGIRCGCGQKGCFEAYGSGTALERMGREALQLDPVRSTRLRALASSPTSITGSAIALAASEGDPLSIELIDTLGWWIGRGAASLVAVLDPSVIVVGGGVASVGDLLFTGIERGLGEHLTGRDNRPRARILPARLGNNAGLVGAADLA